MGHLQVVQLVAGRQVEHVLPGLQVVLPARCCTFFSAASCWLLHSYSQLGHSYDQITSICYSNRCQHVIG